MAAGQRFELRTDRPANSHLFCKITTVRQMQPALPDIFISAHASLAASNTPECRSDTPQSPPAAQAWPSPSDSPPSPAWLVPSTRAHNNLTGCSYFFFWLCHVVFRIPVPQPGIKPGPPAVEAQCPNYWTTREFPESMLLEGRDLVLFVFPGCLTHRKHSRNIYQVSSW